MENNEFKIILEKKAQEIGIVLQEKQINQFYQYMNLLLEWNQKMNLTAITDPKEIIEKHFIDSLTIAKYIKPGRCVLDLGTGAGFPGIPLKIYRENLELILVDSLNKRIGFLNEVVHQLALKDIETVHGRAEELGKNKIYREKFDIVTSRAVANLSTLSEYLLPFLKEKGLAICMKGPDVEEEIAQAKKAIEILGGKLKEVEKFTLSENKMGRSIVLIEKIRKTPSNYPRKPGTPAKEPIC